jgi:hypothetical protein
MQPMSIARRSAVISFLHFDSGVVDAAKRWNASPIAVGAHTRTGAARLFRQRRRRCLPQSRRSLRYARRTRPQWIIKRRPRHRRFCSIRARSRP